MLKSPSGVPFHIGIMLVAWTALSPIEAAADGPTNLVVVSDASMKDSVKRIGRGHIRVEVLFAPDTNTIRADYKRCLKRVRNLSEFQLLLLGVDTQPTVQEFWRERMTATNPKGRVHRLTQPRSNTKIEHQVQRAKDVHRALALILPEQRARLDANLKSELRRLYWLQFPPQLAWRK